MSRRGAKFVKKGLGSWAAGGAVNARTSPSGSTIYYAPGFNGQDTTGDSIQFADAASISPTAACTYIFRAKQLTEAGILRSRRGFLSQWSNTVGADNRLFIRTGSSDATIISVICGDGTAAGTSINVQSATANVDFQTSFKSFAFRYDGSQGTNAGKARIYYNGAELTTGVTYGGTWPSSLPNTSAPLWLGDVRGITSANSWLRGYMRDVAIFNVALANADILAIHNGTDPRTVSGCVFFLPFTEGSGTSATDSVGGLVGTFSHTSGTPGRGPVWTQRDWLGGSTSGGTKILCFGDSKTDGTGYDGAYRAELRNQLVGRKGKASASFDFVGANTDSTERAEFSFDEQHAGTAGQHLDTAGSTDMLGRGPTAMTTYTPNIVIIQGGTNDIIGGDTATQARDDLLAVVRACEAAHPGAKYFLWEAPLKSSHGNYATFNTYCGLLSAACTTLQGDPIDITYVDTFSLLGDDDCVDTVHPNQIGYEKIAYKLADAIAAYI